MDIDGLRSAVNAVNAFQYFFYQFGFEVLTDLKDDLEKNLSQV